MASSSAMATSSSSKYSSSNVKMSSSSASKVSSKSTKTYTYKSSGGDEDSNVMIEYHADLSSLSRLEDKIRLLQEDIEYEREIRQRVEREKADLSVQVIQLKERVEEVEAGADGQYEINRKRDAELAKLRKLLEDVHLESEQTIHMLKKKHVEAVADFQDQTDILSKSRTKLEKDKGKMQSEVYELTEHLEKVTLESANYHKTIKSLNIQISELSIKIEEMNRTVIDITSSKQRLSIENVELHRSVQELKVKIEEITYITKGASGSLEEYKRKYEDEERRRRKLETDYNSLIQEITTIRRSYDEECELRLDIERKYSNETQASASYKSKWEHESKCRVEEVEEMKKRMSIRILELEETINSLNVKITGVEKQKARFSQEIEIMILDMEKANTSHREMKSRLEIVEREHKTLVIKYEELNMLYEQSCKDLKFRIMEITKITHEYESIKESHGLIMIENKKLSGEGGDLKATLNDLTRLKHELEVEIRRLETERTELANALTEADHARKNEEHRCLKISQEYHSFKIDIEKRFCIKEEELECIKKQMTIEVESLNSRVVDAETRLKSEVSKIKKKMQITITELEMSLDTTNRSNIELQKTCKKQSIQLQELQTHYDELQRQLQQTLDQYGVAQRRLQCLTSEYEEARANLDAAVRARRNVELQYEESAARLKDLSTINVNLSACKIKLEQEISIIAADYDEVTRELKIADERLSKATCEIKRTTELFHEEQERYIKIETIKKSLEVEVKNLTIRIESGESNMMANTKRVISKLEIRISELEAFFEEEKRCHMATVNILKKKERNIKELVLQCEEDHKNIQILQETLDKSYEKINIYKRQLNEQETVSATNITRVRRFQRELESAEERAECAESNLNMIRAKHRTFVTSQTTTLPSGEQIIIKETVTKH